MSLVEPTENSVNQRLPGIPSDFYSRPDRFSFKDLLATLFSLGFCCICYRALTEPQALELVKAVGYLMAVILGGYFGQEITSALVTERRNGRSRDFMAVQPLDSDSKQISGI